MLIRIEIIFLVVNLFSTNNFIYIIDKILVHLIFICGYLIPLSASLLLIKLVIIFLPFCFFYC